MKKIRKFIFFLLGAGLIFPPKLANAQEFNYKVNAMYIYYFTKYIHWENNAPGPITIGIIGDSQVKEELENLAIQNKSGGANIIVRRIDLSEVKKCQIVVISKSSSQSLLKVEEATKNLAVLIITEKQGMATKGAGICIYIDDEDGFKTKFELSIGNVQRRGLKVSHELMSLAELVN